MFHFPDSDTGYYDDERSFFDHDRELELAELEREDRFEVEAEEMLANLWAGPTVPLVSETPIASGTFGTENHIDPETGCTAVEMGEADRIPLRSLKIGDPSPSDAASLVMFPPEMSVGQTITARWGRGARRRKGVA
jgi:hypothetical protein